MLQQAFVELSTSHLIFFILAIIGVCCFEFVNGFHDTANAVATVIYTRSLKPLQAVIWSGAWNFLGVWLGGVAVAISIINLLPVSDMMAMSQGENISIVFAVLLSAIIWNLATWYLGIPCSSSHTLIGSLLGAGMGFFWMHGGNGINWGKAKDIGLSLLLSPAFGFSAVILILFLFKILIRNKEIFKDPSQNENRPPPWWIRSILIITCTLVSFFHGNNDGQKGVGIIMVVLLVMLPGYYSLNPGVDTNKLKEAVHHMKEATMEYSLDLEHNMYAKPLAVLDDLVNEIDTLHPDSKEQKLQVRKHIQIFSKSAKAMLEDPGFIPDNNKRKQFVSALHNLKDGTDYAPVEAILLISLSLGFGTMVGWKRIVITIGEKIGKTHLTYAQGAAAELVAAGTIGMSSGLGLPVSTTHVLSSGVAGSMVGMGGLKNLQRNTIATIATAWLLTLPVTFIASLVFYYLFQLFV
ncbi:MAG TPA: inorganic phosphate transporter [Saprospiraceae bacterium]|nr:inorganic phosphate transporter [Saprospiraceae bacterium]